MPIYEYHCLACGHEYEALQKMSAEPLVSCPECSEPELKKKISAAGFRLKGSGWYETDFKNGSKKNDAGAGESKSTEKSTTKASDKPAAKSGCCGGGSHSH